MIVALYDQNNLVKKTIEKEIIEKFSIEDIVNSFIDKAQQKSSLKIAIRDILDKNLNLNTLTHRYFKDLYMSLEKEVLQEQNLQNHNYQYSNEMDARNYNQK